MHVYIDADACPRPVKAVLFRAAERRGIRVTVVSNQWQTVPEIEAVTYLPVKPGPDVADEKIIELVTEGDVVVTADIPLADEIVAKGAIGISPRGELFTAENIGGIRATRDMLAEFRESGMELSSGPAAYTDRDKQSFANALDRLLTQAGL